jgi:hypothetical protein
MHPDTQPNAGANVPWPLRWSAGLARVGATALILVLVLCSFGLLGLVNVLQAWGHKYGS